MKYTEAGTYSITYIATDECGNETRHNRTVHVHKKMTVLFTDGTLIINEISSNREANIEAHGAVVAEYVPLDSDNTYVWGSGNDQLWFNERSRIKYVEFGSPVAPDSIAYWLQLSGLESIDFTNCDCSNVASARAAFASTNITELVLPSMPNLTSIQYMCNRCYDLATVDFSNVGATAVINTQDAFQGCYALTEISFVGLAGMVDNCERMFANVNSDGHGNMQIATIYSDGALKFWQASASTNMFRSCTGLVGGNGTTFRSDVTNKDYARIDEPGTPGYFTQA